MSLFVLFDSAAGSDISASCGRRSTWNTKLPCFLFFVTVLVRRRFVSTAEHGPPLLSAGERLGRRRCLLWFYRIIRGRTVTSQNNFRILPVLDHIWLLEESCAQSGKRVVLFNSLTLDLHFFQFGMWCQDFVLWLKTDPHVQRHFFFWSR